VGLYVPGACVRRRPGPELVEAPAELDVRLVRPDHEALVEIAVDLLVDGRHHRRRAVPEVLAGDPAGEVEELAAVDVPDARPFGPFDDEGRRRDAARDIPLACGEQAFGGAGSFFDGHRRPGLSLRDAAHSSASCLALRGIPRQFLRKCVA
jgi:hypothetical protein